MQHGDGRRRDQVENNVTWSYQLALPPGARGPVTIGAAHVRVGGQELSSNAVPVRVGAAAAAPPPQRQQRRPACFRAACSATSPTSSSSRSSSSASAAFLRAVADKRRAFVGEQVTVTWYLYLAEPPEQLSAGDAAQDATASGSEEIPSTNPQGRLAFTDQVEGGQHYQVAVVLQRALFPLAPGKLTVTPMEAAGRRAPTSSGARSSPRRLKSEPLTIEAVALPREGQPAGFPTGNVGVHARRRRRPRGGRGRRRRDADR